MVAYDLVDPINPRVVARSSLAIANLTTWVPRLAVGPERLYATIHVESLVVDERIVDLDVRQPRNVLRTAARPDEPGP
jgi:hypothetical protein